MWKETQCGWGMLDWILHVKTNALWKNVDYNASLSGNNLNTILVQKETTVVLERNIFCDLCFPERIRFFLFKQLELSTEAWGRFGFWLSWKTQRHTWTVKQEFQKKKKQKLHQQLKERQVHPIKFHETRWWYWEKAFLRSVKVVIRPHYLQRRLQDQMMLQTLWKAMITLKTTFNNI